MTPDSGPGIPGWFVALFILVAVIGVAGTIWRISVARKMASDAGLDPNKATAVALLSDDGIGAAYVASALATHSRPQPAPQAPPQPKTTEQRLQELQALKDKGLVTDEEYTTQRAQILGSI